MNTSANIISNLFPKHLLAILLLLISFSVFSQPCPPGDPSGGESCDGGDPSLPIDGGASLLIAAGVGLIGKKAYQYRKSLKSEING